MCILIILHMCMHICESVCMFSNADLALNGDLIHSNHILTIAFWKDAYTHVYIIYLYIYVCTYTYLYTFSRAQALPWKGTWYTLIISLLLYFGRKDAYIHVCIWYLYMYVCIYINLYICSRMQATSRKRMSHILIDWVWLAIFRTNLVCGPSK